MIQAYYNYILSMNPLPWANSVDAEYGVAQFMAQEVRPERPSPAASTTSDLSCMETFCINEIQKGDAQRQIDILKEEVAKAEKTGNWLALSDYHEDFTLLSQTITEAEDAQYATVRKLKKDIELMEVLMNQWHETKIQFDDAKQKLINCMAQKEEEKKKNSSGSSSIQSEDQKNVDLAIKFDTIRKKLKLTDDQIFKFWRRNNRKLREILSLLRAVSSKKMLRSILIRARQLTESISITE